MDDIILNKSTTIDLAMHMVRSRALGVPQDSRSAFELLRDAGIIDDVFCSGLQKMVGFRNIAVHEYTRLDLDIITSSVSHQQTVHRRCDSGWTRRSGDPAQ